MATGVPLMSIEERRRELERRIAGCDAARRMADALGDDDESSRWREEVARYKTQLAGMPTDEGGTDR